MPKISDNVQRARLKIISHLNSVQQNLMRVIIGHLADVIFQIGSVQRLICCPYEASRENFKRVLQKTSKRSHIAKKETLKIIQENKDAIDVYLQVKTRKNQRRICGRALQYQGKELYCQA